jgi:peptidoglycan L-alanyl-D-glutamate endopeptidase CwlK
MPSFGRKSTRKLLTCHQDIQLIMNEVVQYTDITIVYGHRNEETQNELYDKGFSKLQYPESKHNTLPANAVDIAIWYPDKPHVRWNDRESFIYLGGLVKQIAYRLNIPIRWGGDWDGDLKFTESFFDGGHFELTGV